MEKDLNIPCPKCKQPTVYSEKNPFRPFCSPVCKGEDLVAWANEDYRVPTTEDEQEDEMPGQTAAKEERD